MAAANRWYEPSAARTAFPPRDSTRDEGEQLWKACAAGGAAGARSSEIGAGDDATAPALAGSVGAISFDGIYSNSL